MNEIMLVWEHVRNFGCNEGGLKVVASDGTTATVWPGKIVLH